jgi:methylated-DNA-[protein]-cysteine S-methyltransferase
VALVYGLLETVYGSAIGWVDEADGALTDLILDHTRVIDRAIARGDRRDDNALAHIQTQLSEYSQGRRKVFDLHLKPRGTGFQRAVWRALCDIPFGETTSYGKLAAGLDPAASPRAVGTANGANPIMLIIPCHRVIGADGTLTGFGGGLPLKARMLAFEREHSLSKDDLFAGLEARS